MFLPSHFPACTLLLCSTSVLVLTPACVCAQNVTESRQRAQQADESQLDNSGISTPVKTSGRSTAVSPSSVVETQAGAPLIFSPTVANSEESVYASQYLYLSRVTDDELDATSSEVAAAACTSPAKGATPLSAKDATPTSQRGDEQGSDDHVLGSHWRSRSDDSASPVTVRLIHCRSTWGNRASKGRADAQ